MCTKKPHVPLQLLSNLTTSAALRLLSRFTRHIQTHTCTILSVVMLSVGTNLVAGVCGLMQTARWLPAPEAAKVEKEPQEGQGRSVSVQQRVSAGQWWKVHMSQCHHQLCENEWSGHKGVPKIGWNCPQSENKLPRFQYEKTVFLTYISMWPLLGEARSTEMKHNMLRLLNWKLLLHQDTKMQRNLHESGASRLTDLL